MIRYPPFVACVACGALHFAVSPEEHDDNQARLAELRRTLPGLPVQRKPPRDVRHCSRCGGREMRPVSLDEVRRLPPRTRIDQVIWPPRLIKL